MGKKLQGARLRAKKRAREALDELQTSQAEVAAVSDALFVLDRDGAPSLPPSLRKMAKEEAKKKKVESGLSEHEQKKVERLLRSHDKNELIRIAEEGRKKLETRRNPFRAAKKSKVGKFDLWQEDGESNSKSSLKKERTGPQQKVAGIAPEHTKVTVKPNKPPPEAKLTPAVQAIPGQSYIPDREAQSKVIEKAAAIEIKREMAIKKQKDPISRGFSKETKALLIMDDSDDESSSDEDEDLADGPVGPIPKRAQKLTRAQRNKQKRIRLQEAELAKARQEKKLIKQIGEIPVFKKEIQKMEVEKSQLKKPQADKKRKRPDDPLDIPSIPVLLQSSVSLRSMKVMGSLSEDRRNALADRGLAEKPSFSHDAKLRRKIKRRKTRKKVRDIRK